MNLVRKLNKKWSPICFGLGLAVLFLALAPQFSGASTLQVDCTAECFDLDEGTGHMSFDSDATSAQFAENTTASIQAAKGRGWRDLKTQCPAPSKLMLRVFVKFTQKAYDGEDGSTTTTDSSGSVTDGWGEYDSPEYQSSETVDNQYWGNKNKQKFRLIEATQSSACSGAHSPTPITEHNGRAVGG